MGQAIARPAPTAAHAGIGGKTGYAARSAGLAFVFRFALVLVFAAFLLLDGGLEDVAEGSAAIGGAVLGDRLLLLRDLQRLDRHVDAAAVAVDADDGGIDLVAHVEALGPLL